MSFRALSCSTLDLVSGVVEAAIVIAVQVVAVVVLAEIIAVLAAAARGISRSRSGGTGTCSMSTDILPADLILAEACACSGSIGAYI